MVMQIKLIVVVVVTLNTRPLLPQQQQQQRKISAGKLLDLHLASCVFTPCMLLRKRFLLHRRLVSRKKKVVVLNSCFLQLLGEKTGGVVRNRLGEGRGIKRIFSPILPTESVR